MCIVQKSFRLEERGVGRRRARRSSFKGRERVIEGSELCCKTCSLGTPSPPLNTSPGKTALLPILERIKYKVACMCFSTINGSGPAYLSALQHVYTPSRTLRSSSDTRMLEIQQYKRKTHGFRIFSRFWTPHLEFTPTLLNPVIF